MKMIQGQACWRSAKRYVGGRKPLAMLMPNFVPCDREPMNLAAEPAPKRGALIHFDVLVELSADT